MIGTQLHPTIRSIILLEMFSHKQINIFQEQEEIQIIKPNTWPNQYTRTLLCSIKSTHSIFCYQTFHTNSSTQPAYLGLGLMDSQQGSNQHEIIVFKTNQMNSKYPDVCALIFAATIGSNEATQTLLSFAFLTIETTPRDNLPEREILFLKTTLLEAVNIANRYNHQSVAELIQSSFLWARVYP